MLTKKLNMCSMESWCVWIWSGNEFIHYVTNGDRAIQLRVELTDYNNETAYAEYDDFKIDSNENKYKLISLGNYNGTAGKYSLV